MIKKAVSIRKHLEKNRKDKDSKYRLILIESEFIDWPDIIENKNNYHQHGNMNPQLPALWSHDIKYSYI